MVEQIALGLLLALWLILSYGAIKQVHTHKQGPRMGAFAAGALIIIFGLAGCLLWLVIHGLASVGSCT